MLGGSLKLELVIPMMLATCAEDIVLFEAAKYKGAVEISLAQSTASTRSQAEKTLAAQEVLRQAYPFVPEFHLKIPVFNLASRLPPVARGGKRYRQQTPAAASSSADPAPLSPTKKVPRCRLSRAQRLKADQAQAAAAAPRRNTRSAAASAGNTAAQVQPPPVIPDAVPAPPPPPAFDQYAAPEPTPVPTSAHALPQDVRDAMSQAAASVAGKAFHPSSTSSYRLAACPQPPATMNH